MIFICYYAIFALTTGLAACYELAHPVISFIGKTKPVNHKIVMYILIFMLTTLLAPLFFMSCIIPDMGTRFRQAFHNELTT